MSIPTDLKLLVRSRAFRGVLWGIGIIVVLLLVFKAGEFVGFRKAGFSYRVGEQYFRVMMGPRGGVVPRGAKPRDFMMGHGIFGRVVSVSTSSLVIEGRGGAAQVVLITPRTVINRFHDTISADALRADDSVVVIGRPNDAGQVEARLIRVMPALPPMPPASAGASVDRPASGAVPVF